MPTTIQNCDFFDVAKSSDSFMLYLSKENNLEVRKTH